jgi:hypothetical protein
MIAIVSFGLKKMDKLLNIICLSDKNEYNPQAQGDQEQGHILAEQF